jgi:predicted ATP-dependent serine protease
MKILSVQNLLSKKHKKFEFTGRWKECFGEPPVNGVWIIMAPPKQGKTTFALLLTKYLSNFEKVLYVSAEEEDDAMFCEAVSRLEIPSCPNIGFTKRETMEEISARLKKRNAAKIVIIDNLTMYPDFKSSDAQEFMRLHKNILLIFISHMERKEPSTAAGKYLKKMAKIIVSIEGLKANIESRGGNSGTMLIHEEGAQRYGIVE